MPSVIWPGIWTICAWQDRHMFISSAGQFLQQAEEACKPLLLLVEGPAT